MTCNVCNNTGVILIPKEEAKFATSQTVPCPKCNKYKPFEFWMDVIANSHYHTSFFSLIMEESKRVGKRNTVAYGQLISQYMREAHDISIRHILAARNGVELEVLHLNSKVEYQTFLKESIKILLNAERSIVKDGFVRIELEEDHKCTHGDLGRYRIEYKYPLHLIHLGEDLHRANMQLSDELKQRWYIR